MKGRKILDLYNEHAKDCAPTDFLGQMRRTVNGIAIDQAQVEMIVARILAALAIESNDLLIDLCCGNGALSDRILSACAGGRGVDIGDYLIVLANRHFGGAGRSFIVDDVADYVVTEETPGPYTKALCYGSFAYLSQEAARTVLCGLRERFTSVARVFIGNLPDKTRMEAFYDGRDYVPGIETDSESHIGAWRTPDEFAALANETGWEAEVTVMPQAFYAAHYRYDVTLTPR